MKHYEAEVTYVDTVVAVTCDFCGHHWENVYELQEFHHIDFVAGYGSVFGDGTHVTCDICQHCLNRLLKGFAKLEPRGM